MSCLNADHRDILQRKSLEIDLHVCNMRTPPVRFRPPKDECSR